MRREADHSTIPGQAKRDPGILRGRAWRAKSWMAGTSNVKTALRASCPAETV